MNTLPLDSPDLTLDIAGGKGANLARLVRAGFAVPPGFVVTTAAYDTFLATHALAPWIADQLRTLSLTDPATLDTASAAIRRRFEATPIPPPLADSILAAYQALISNLQSPIPLAVRSSATAEDLPEMSFAGQQDTYLNVVGEAALLDAVRRCWASLWTARAIGYRARNGIPQEAVALAVVVQAMVPSESSGVLFTANPLTGRRGETVVDATFGLGEALVSGQVEPDHYVVDAPTERILSKRLGSKALAIRSKEGGGTRTTAEDAATTQALPDAAIVELTQLGQRVEQLFGGPQDIEWGWAEGRLFLLQSRPITSLYPVPDGAAGGPLRVFVSFGAVQGMLEPMTPLGQDTIKGVFAGMARWLGVPVTVGTQEVIRSAGERLWINMTALVRNSRGRRLLRRALPHIEPSVAQAMEPLWEDPALAPTSSRPSPRARVRALRFVLPLALRFVGALVLPDTNRRQAQRRFERIVARFEARARGAHTLAERVTLFEAVLAEAFPRVVPEAAPRVIAGVVPLVLLHRLAARYAPTLNVLELTRGLPHNVTTEMDLALWEVAQVIRHDPMAARRFAAEETPVLGRAYAARTLPPAAQRAIGDFLQRYGARGLAEIDFGRPRWEEDPTLLFSTLRSYSQITDPTLAPAMVFARGAAAAEAAIAHLAEAVRPHGGTLAVWGVRWLARRTRALAGLRESPKFTLIRLLGLARRVLLASGQDLAAQGILEQPDDLFFLHLDELRALARGEAGNWRARVAERRETAAREGRRGQVPRLLLSDGRAFYGGILASAADGDDAIIGTPVSPGTVEGRVRVVFDPHEANLAPGDILVCPGTDPAWTPLFLAAGGLVMEVGGLMTHGSVVAREYGIPAVVGVHRATERLHDGQLVRVDGATGRVVVL